MLCACDPYAVVGARAASGRGADLVTGPATNTEAGLALVKQLSGLGALHVLEKSALAALRTLLYDKLGLSLAEGEGSAVSGST